MKKYSIIIVLFLMLASNFTFAQLAKDSWAFGFGFDYPRFASINITPRNGDFGAYLSLQKNFSEHIGVRFSGGWAHMISGWTNPNSLPIYTTTDAITGDFDMLYYLVPCENISPYVFGGLGADYKILLNKATSYLKDKQLAGQANVGVGIEWNIDPAWRIVSEFGYHVAANSELDGALGNGEVGGRDTYIGIKVGALYYFSKGEPSKYCQLYTGIKDEGKDLTNYDRIEEMIKKHIPKEVVKEVVVEKASKATTSDRWVLIGVNFAFNSSKLNGEAFPILYDAAKTLLKNPDVKVEIQGYCDYIGSDAYNKKLSQRRAETVKDYLESKGVAAARLTAVGYGKTDFVADNKTAEGRAMNRRIEFKVQ
jgi:outer membrane protein OmpA-like peptidoglycan-associated protein